MVAFWKSHRALLVALLLLLAAGGLFLGYRGVANRLREQHIAPEFQGEAAFPCAQVTAFLAQDTKLDEEKVYTFRQSLDEAYVAASLEALEGGALYKDAWSCEATVNAVGDKGGATVKALGVGGDFFAFHPRFLRSGSTIAETDFALDTVVLDRELAWRLYGSIDVTGMDITIGGKPFVVSGVIYRQEDGFTRAAEEARGEVVTGLYLNWQSLQALGETTPVAYELVGANPIRSFLQNQLEKGFAGAVVLENTGRYAPLRLWEVLRSFGRRSMRAESLVFPVWENAARGAEDVATLLLLLCLLCLLFPVFYLITQVVKGVKWGTRTVAEAVPDLLDKLSERRYQRKMKKTRN